VEGDAAQPKLNVRKTLDNFLSSLRASGLRWAVPGAGRSSIIVRIADIVEVVVRVSRRLDLLEQLVSPLPVGTRFFDSRPQPYLHDKICRYHQCKNEGTAAHRSRRQINQQQMIVDCAECRIARRLTLSNMWRPDATIANVGVQVWQFGITSQIDPGHCTIPPILNRLRVDRESYPLLLINIQPAMLYSLKAALAR